MSDDIRERVARAITKAHNEFYLGAAPQTSTLQQYEADAALSAIGYREVIKALEYCETFFDGWWMSDEEMQAEADGCQKAVSSALSRARGETT